MTCSPSYALLWAPEVLLRHAFMRCGGQAMGSKAVSGHEEVCNMREMIVQEKPLEYRVL